MEAVMIDQTHTKTVVPIQTAPVVFAALITTCGVILAAFIQSGYFGRANPATIALSQPTITSAQASFLGTIEPLAESPSEVSHQAGATVDFKPVLSPGSIEPVAAFLPAVNTPALVGSRDLRGRWSANLYLALDVPGQPAAATLPRRAGKTGQKVRRWECRHPVFQRARLRQATKMWTRHLGGKISPIGLGLAVQGRDNAVARCAIQRCASYQRISDTREDRPEGGQFARQRTL